MSVNQRRMNRMSRSPTSERTSSALRGATVLVIGRERYLLAGRPHPTLRRMPARRAVLAFLVFLTACGSSVASGSHPSGSGSTAGAPPCGPTSAHTIVADGAARVYSMSGTVHGCARHGHGSYRLGSTARSIREGRVGPVALAGSDAAYGIATFGVDTGSSQIVVR